MENNLNDLFDVEKNRFQMIGSILLVAVFAMAFLSMTYIPLIVLGIVGAIDLYIIYVLKSTTTISKWIRQLFGSTTDGIILICLIVICFWLKGSTIALWFFLGLLNNHLFEKD